MNSNAREQERQVDVLMTAMAMTFWIWSLVRIVPVLMNALAMCHLVPMMRVLVVVL